MLPSRTDELITFMFATLDAALVLNPIQATKIHLINTTIDHISNKIHVHFELINTNGATVERRVITVDGTAVQNWISNQEITIMNRLMLKMGVTGSIG